MQARGPLMIEHRLIEKMLVLFRREINRIKETGQADPVFVDIAVDFFRTYGDRTHHGKEEEILFRELEKKDMSPSDKATMAELINDHKLGRVVTSELVNTNTRYRNRDDTALGVIAEKLHFLVEFYPRHIEKEDKVFFPAMMRYLYETDQQIILSEFWEFDRTMIHEKYRNVIDSLSRQ